MGGPWAGGGDPPGVPAVPMSLALKARQKAKRKGGGAKERVFGCDLLEHLQQSGKDGDFLGRGGEPRGDGGVIMGGVTPGSVPVEEVGRGHGDGATRLHHSVE